MSIQPTLQTDRLILRPFTLNDAPNVYRLVRVREIADTTLAIPHPYTPGMAEAWISTHQDGFEKGESDHFAISLREGGKLVGAIGMLCQAKVEMSPF
jgi:[ribosomal protein S5]-alanine N-acetyltransferase